MAGFLLEIYFQMVAYSNKTYLAQEIQFWEFMGGSNLAQWPLINFGLIQFQEGSLSVVPVSLFCDNIGWPRTISRRKSYPINVVLWSLLQLLLSTKNLTSGELNARNSLHFCLTQKFFMFESIAMHDLI